MPESHRRHMQWTPGRLLNWALAIGPATRDALEGFHLKVDITAKEYVAEGLLEALSAHDMQGKRILISRAAVARDVLPDTLRQRGAEVEAQIALGEQSYLTGETDLARDQRPDRWPGQSRGKLAISGRERVETNDPLPGK